MSPNNEEKLRCPFFGPLSLVSNRGEESNGNAPMLLKPHSSPHKISIKRTETESGDSCNDASIEMQTAPEAVPFDPSTKKVSFGTVELREYERIVSDNPAVRCIPAIGIGWRYEKRDPLQVDTFESNRKTPPRKRHELVLSGVDRDKLLIEHGITRQEMAEATISIIKTKRDRTTTRSMMKTEGIQVAMETASRKIKKLVKLEPSTKKQQKMLWKKAEKQGFVERRTTWPMTRVVEEQDLDNCRDDAITTELQDPATLMHNGQDQQGLEMRVNTIALKKLNLQLDNAQRLGMEKKQKADD